MNLFYDLISIRSHDPSSKLAQTVVDYCPGLGGLPLGQAGHQLGGDLQVGQQEEGQRVR